MKTRCLYCHTAFYVQPEQLKVHAGRVRCGRCKKVFNSLDNLIDVDDQGNSQLEQIKEMLSPSAPDPADLKPLFDDSLPNSSKAGKNLQENGEAEIKESAIENLQEESLADDEAEETAEVDDEDVQNAILATDGAEDVAIYGTDDSLHAHQGDTGLTPGVTQNLQDLIAQLGLLQPKDASCTQSNNKWVENYTLFIQRPLMISIVVLLVLIFAGQFVFYYRGEIALNSPRLRSLLETASRLFDQKIPLPRHPEWVSIEASDLQKDPAYGNLLVLNATLRNKATYDQAFPSLELSLTNTQELVIARRIFHPEEYLPQKFQQGKIFKGNSDTTIRLWIDAHNIKAVGYRLYAFYL